MILTTIKDYQDAILQGKEIKHSSVFYTGELEEATSPKTDKPLRFDVGSYDPDKGIFAGILKGKEVWLALKDAPKQMNWTDAKEWCEEQGGHLPTIDELTVAYLNKDEINKALVAHGGEELKEVDWYWSSTEYDNDYGWIFDMYNGDRYYANKYSYSYYVRCFQLL